MEKDRTLKETKEILNLLVIFVIVLLCFCSVATACPDPECDDCYSWNEEEEECVWVCGSGECCHDTCCATYLCESCDYSEVVGWFCPTCNNDPCQDCCDGTCYDIETKDCCENLTIYNKATEKCCNDGLGNTCPKSPVDKECCDGDCCDPTECESCIDAECVVCEGTGITCCDGDCCEYTNETCCDDNCCPPVGSSNGCGPRDDEDPCSLDDPANCSAPDDSSFRSACDAHDICFGTCGNDITDCNDDFDDAMSVACNDNSPLCWTICKAAQLVYILLEVIVGGDYYDAGQECGCCLDPP